jgi:VCBS repeat-containing protein
VQTLARCLWRDVSHFSAVLWYVPVLRPWLAVGLALLFLTAPAYAATVSLAWDPPSTNAAQVGGYNLYYWQPLWESPAHVSVGKNTTYTLTGLENGKTYSIAVTSLDSTGKNESKYSNIIEMQGSAPPPNTPPVAKSDTATTAEDTAVTIAVLANDTDTDGNPLTIAAVTPGVNGTATPSGSAVTYKPKANFHGTDAFTYTVSDGKGGTATGQVSVTVTPINDAPMAHNGTLTAPAATKTSGTLSASDVDKDTLTYQLVSQGSKGTITLTNTTTGAYAYTAKPQMTGTDTFTFRVSDGKATSNTATVTITITPAEAENVVFAVNAGGPRYVDAAGTVYEADTRFSGGSTYSRPAPIAGTNDDVLYQSGRLGNFAYAIPMPNGDYVVTLRFAEPYMTEAGKRVFDVLIEGQEVVSNLDLIAKAGPLTEYDVKILVQVTDEQLNIRFQAAVGNAIVNAIVVEALGD